MGVRVTQCPVTKKHQARHMPTGAVLYVDEDVREVHEFVRYYLGWNEHYGSGSTSTQFGDRYEAAHWVDDAVYQKISLDNRKIRESYGDW